MKRINQWLKKLSPSRKMMVSVVCLFFAALSFVSSSDAWKSVSQQALNMGHTKVEKKAVHLLKLEKNSEGEATEKAIEGAKFYLYHVKKGTAVQIGSVYTSDKAGKIPVTLAPGDYYFEEFDPSVGYTFDTDKEGKAIKRYPFTVTLASSNEEAIVVAYNQRESGSLEVLKEVLNQDGSTLTAAQKKLVFEFQVTFSDGGTYRYQVDGGKQVALKSGEWLRLTHGQKAVFETMPQGVHYSIIEKAVTGYQVQANNSSGNITKKPSLAHFTNTYAPQIGQLEVSKEIINGDGSNVTAAQKKLDFEFVLTLSDEKTPVKFVTNTGRNGALVSGDSFTLKHGEVLTLQDLPIGLTYEVKEKTLADYTSSPFLYRGVIRSTETVTLPFINQYLMEKDSTGSLSFGKQVIAEEINQEAVFAFKLSFSDKGTYHYQLGDTIYSHTSGEIIYLKHDEHVSFTDLPVGITYELSEQPAAGYQGELTEVSGTILSNHEVTIQFNNHQEEQAQLVLHKTGIGEGFEADKEFTFNVWLNGEKLKDPISLKAGESSLPLTLAMGDRRSQRGGLPPNRFN